MVHSLKLGSRTNRLEAALLPLGVLTCRSSALGNYPSFSLFLQRLLFPRTSAPLGHWVGYPVWASAAFEASFTPGHARCETQLGRWKRQARVLPRRPLHLRRRALCASKPNPELCRRRAAADSQAQCGEKPRRCVGKTKISPAQCPPGKDQMRPEISHCFTLPMETPPGSIWKTRVHFHEENGAWCLPQPRCPGLATPTCLATATASGPDCLASLPSRSDGPDLPRQCFLLLFPSRSSLS